MQKGKKLKSRKKESCTLHCTFYLRSTNYTIIIVYSLFCFVFSYSYKFTLDKLYPMMVSVKLRAESYKEWVSTVQEILENKGDKKKGLKKILQNVHTAKQSKYALLFILKDCTH